MSKCFYCHTINECYDEDGESICVNRAACEMRQSAQYNIRQAEHFKARHEALLYSLKLWMVGWRDDLKPEARTQLEAVIQEHE